MGDLKAALACGAIVGAVVGACDALVFPEPPPDRVERQLPRVVVVARQAGECCCHENACCEVSDGI